MRAVLVLAALALAGCVDVVAEDAPDKCGWLRTGVPQSGASGLVVLLDRSNSTRAAGADNWVVDPLSTLDETLRDAVGRHDVVSIGSFDGSAASVRWAAQGLVTERGREHQRKRSADDATARECLDQQVVAAAATPPSHPGSDILGAVGIAKDDLAVVAGDRRIVVVTDGLATVGCADLTRLPVGMTDLIPEVRALCVEREHALPDLSGVHLAMAGVGHPAQSAPQPDTAHLRWLADLWTGLCGDANAIGCSVSVQPVDTIDAGERTADPDVPDAEIVYPAVDGGLTPPPTVIQLSGEVLFANNSSDITAAGRRAIAVAAAGVRDKGRVVVNGYTQAEASPVENKKLATERATAVAEVLGEHGIADVLAVGHEGRAPHCPPGESAAALRCTRRVDIVVGGSG